MGFRFFTTENKRHTLPPYEIFVVFLDPLIAHWFGRSPSLSFHILEPGSLGIKILAIQAKFFCRFDLGWRSFMDTTSGTVLYDTLPPTQYCSSKRRKPTQQNLFNILISLYKRNKNINFKKPEYMNHTRKFLCV